MTIRDNEVGCYHFSESIGEMAQKISEVWGRPTVEAVDLAYNQDDETGDFSVMRNLARTIVNEEALLTEASTCILSIELSNAITLSSYLEREVSLPIARDEYDNLLSALRARGVRKKSNVVIERVAGPRTG